MTAEEFKAALAGLKWRQADFARKAGVVPNTVSRWATGEVEIPSWAESFIGMATEIQRLHEKYVLPDRMRRTDE